MKPEIKTVYCICAYRGGKICIDQNEAYVLHDLLNYTKSISLVSLFLFKAVDIMKKYAYNEPRT